MAVVDGRGESHALKVPKPDIPPRMVKREIALLKHAGKNEHLVEFKKALNTEIGTCLLFELLLPKTLGSLMTSRVTLTEPEVRWFILKIAEGIKHLNSRGLAHCDLKPANILIAYDMTPKLSDLGNAEYLGSEAEQRCGFTGTPGYVAPEVVLREQHTFKMDMFSLGIIVSMMLNGYNPELTDRFNVHKVKLAALLTNTTLSLSAKGLLKELLHFNVKERLNVGDLAEHEFFSSGLCLRKLDQKAFDEEPLLDVLGKHSHDENYKDHNEVNTGEVEERPMFKKLRSQPRAAPIGINAKDEALQETKCMNDGLVDESKSVKVGSPGKVVDLTKDRGEDKDPPKEIIAGVAVVESILAAVAVELDPTAIIGLVPAAVVELSVPANAQGDSQIIHNEAAPTEVVVQQERSRGQTRDVCDEYLYMTALACTPSHQDGKLDL
ncbi:MAG: kinase-like domain-containing protein [Linnemannia gamsii]|nr:MAG: kinase-like domain-containing protein [Linnemannia gamsii]